MSQYLDRRQAQQTYRPGNGVRSNSCPILLITQWFTTLQLMSPGLQRAREPFRLHNALTGLGLGLLAFGIYSYSISAVRQDVFDDVDEEAKALARTGTSSGSASLASDGSAPSKPPSTPLTKDQEQQIMESAFSAAVDTSGSSTMASKGDGVVSNSTKNSGALSSQQQKPNQGAGISHKLTRWLPWSSRDR